ncbi:hypothetical protein KIN20_028191 [Parelaphostrongylus tenuis]|uniref:Uncharacterized protein n=1 Tax=Parelaphostrongylus tenuis TaxID=148309 RepID=A0AAD5R0D9_PARTN|nr:hypothetical protein KIN20_028191 [Parelaphostrongylus tenuis]
MDNVDHIHLIHSNEGRVRDLESGQKRRTKGKEVAEYGKGRHERSGRQYDTILTATPQQRAERPLVGSRSDVPGHGIVHDRSQLLREVATVPWNECYNLSTASRLRSGVGQSI